LGSFDPAIYAFLDWGACPPNDLEISTTNWPGPNQGMAVVATDTQWEGSFKVVYYFSDYAYYPGTLSISEAPGQEFVGFGNCGAPSEQWSAHETGSLGISGNGIAVCPEEFASGDPVPCYIGGFCSLLLPDQCALAGGVVLSDLSMCTEAACVAILPPEDPFEVLPSTINPLEECRLFEEIGVVYVEKPIPHIADTVTVVQNRAGQWYDVFQPSPYRMYFLHLRNTINICAPAVAEILLDLNQA
jgi:hypothetical protein